MSHRNGDATRAAVLASLAALEHLALLWWATGAFLEDYRRPTDMPVGTVMALMLYLGATVSGAAASWFYFRTKRSVMNRHERIQWTAFAGAMAPWTIAGGTMVVLFLGPIGWLLGPSLGGIAPYVLIARKLPSGPHPANGPDGEISSNG